MRAQLRTSDRARATLQRGCETCSALGESARCGGMSRRRPTAPPSDHAATTGTPRPRPQAEQTTRIKGHIQGGTSSYQDGAGRKSRHTHPSPRTPLPWPHVCRRPHPVRGPTSSSTHAAFLSMRSNTFYTFHPAHSPLTGWRNVHASHRAKCAEAPKHTSRLIHHAGGHLLSGSGAAWEGARQMDC